METDDAFQELNPDEIDITKVPSLPSRLEIKDPYSLLYEEKAQPSQRVPWKRESKSLIEVLPILASIDESQFQETSISSQSLLETISFEKT